MVVVTPDPSHINERRCRGPHLLYHGFAVTAHLPLSKRKHTYTRITHAMHPNDITDILLLTYDSQSFLLGGNWERGVSLFIFGLLSRWPFTTHSETGLEAGWNFYLVVRKRNAALGDLFSLFSNGGRRELHSKEFFAFPSTRALDLVARFSSLFLSCFLSFPWSSFVPFVFALLIPWLRYLPLRGSYTFVSGPSLYLFYPRHSCLGCPKPLSLLALFFRPRRSTVRTPFVHYFPQPNDPLLTLPPSPQLSPSHTRSLPTLSRSSFGTLLIILHMASPHSSLGRPYSPHSHSLT